MERLATAIKGLAEVEEDLKGSPFQTPPKLRDIAQRIDRIVFELQGLMDYLQVTSVQLKSMAQPRLVADNGFVPGNRNQRLVYARERGTHTNQEWERLLLVCGNGCVRCGSLEDIQKDHIVPLHLGGSDSIDNLQPLCQRCNCGKSSECVDYRPTTWARMTTSCTK